MPFSLKEIYEKHVGQTTNQSFYIKHNVLENKIQERHKKVQHNQQGLKKMERGAWDDVGTFYWLALRTL